MTILSRDVHSVTVLKSVCPVDLDGHVGQRYGTTLPVSEAGGHSVFLKLCSSEEANSGFLTLGDQRFCSSGSAKAVLRPPQALGACLILRGPIGSSFPCHLPQTRQRELTSRLTKCHLDVSGKSLC